MRRSRIFIERTLQSGEACALPAPQANYVSRVLRLRSGAPITVFNGRGGEFEATVETSERRSVTIRIGEFLSDNRASPLELRLAQGISRGERMDYVVQKAVELGVNHIEPLITARSVVHLDPQRAQRRAERWREIVVSACEQCGRNLLPRIAPVTQYQEWITQRDHPGLKLMLEPRAPRGLDSIRHEGGSVTLLIGPEGGLSQVERDAAAHVGYVGIAFGPRILRTETAAVAGLAALQLCWGDLS